MNERARVVRRPGERLYIAPAIRTTRSGMAPRSTTGWRW